MDRFAQENRITWQMKAITYNYNTNDFAELWKKWSGYSLVKNYQIFMADIFAIMDNYAPLIIYSLFQCHLSSYKVRDFQKLSIHAKKTIDYSLEWTNLTIKSTISVSVNEFKRKIKKMESRNCPNRLCKEQRSSTWSAITYLFCKKKLQKRSFFCRRHVYHVENLVKIIKYFLNVHYFGVIMSALPYCAFTIVWHYFQTGVYFGFFQSFNSSITCIYVQKPN